MSMTELEEKIRHSAAHVLAMAVLRKFPDARLGIGPVTDSGFYYEFLIEELDLDQLTPKLLADLEVSMYEIIDEDLPFSQQYLEKNDAQDMLLQDGQIFKSELINSLPQNQISFYKTGEEFIDLCRGPHVESTGQMGGVKLLGFSKHHWLDDENRPLLLRINGVAFNTLDDLEEYERKQKEHMENKHFRIGEELKIYSPYYEQGSLVVTLLNNGARLKRLLKQFAVEFFNDAGFSELEFKQLWKREVAESHELFKNIKKTEVAVIGEDNQFVYLDNNYLQLSDFIGRDERLGLNANYVYFNCEYQLTELKIPEKLDKGIEMSMEYSRQVESLQGLNSESDNLKIGEQVEQLTRLLLKFHSRMLQSQLKLQVKSNSDTITQALKEIDVEIAVKQAEEFELKLIYTDTIGEQWELGQIKLLAEFNGEAGKSRLNFVAISNLEQYIALILERYAKGTLPFAITPFHTVVLVTAESARAYAEEIKQQLRRHRLRVDFQIHYDEQSLTEKIEELKRLKYPYILQIGQTDLDNKVFSVIPQSGQELGLMNLEEFLEKSADLL